MSLTSNKITPDVESLLSKDIDDETPDYRRMARNRCGWIILLTILVIGLLALIIYREVATPLKEYYESKDYKS